MINTEWSPVHWPLSFMEVFPPICMINNHQPFVFFSINIFTLTGS